MIRIITDFDGPIMDVSERYYQVYKFCLAQASFPDQSPQQLPKPEFWRLKRAQVPERQIGQLSGLGELQAKEFAHLRRQTVHTLPYLKYDTPIAGAVEILERLQDMEIDLVLMTMRRTSELEEALSRCNLSRFFAPNRRYCLSDTYVKTTDVADKPLLMQRAIAELFPAESWMVGDTEADIAAAKTHGLKVISVLSGIRDRTQLEQHQPDWVAADLAEAVDIILKHANHPAYLNAGNC